MFRSEMHPQEQLKGRFAQQTYRPVRLARLFVNDASSTIGVVMRERRSSLSVVLEALFTSKISQPH